MAIYYVEDSHYEVREKLGTYTLVLNKGTCDCEVWDMSEISCVHACAAIEMEHDNVEFKWSMTMRRVLRITTITRKHGQKHVQGLYSLYQIVVLAQYPICWPIASRTYQSVR